MKTYHITLQGQDYTICLRSYSVEINGTRYKIRSLPASTPPTAPFIICARLRADTT